MKGDPAHEFQTIQIINHLALRGRPRYFQLPNSITYCTFDHSRHLSKALIKLESQKKIRVKNVPLIWWGMSSHLLKYGLMKSGDDMIARKARGINLILPKKAGDILMAFVEIKELIIDEKI